MDLNLVIGIGASIFTGTSLLPQLVKLVKEKKADDISIWMLGVLLAGLCLWVYYGMLQEDYIIILSNAFSALVNITIIILAARYKKN